MTELSVLDQLKKARALGVTVYIDNDHIGAYHPDFYDEDDSWPEPVLNADPREVLETLLTYFGVDHEPV